MILRRFSILAPAYVLALVAFLPAAGADHGNADQASPNMIHVDGHQRSGVNSDLAFWENLAAAGNYSGFRLFDIRNPENAVLLTTVTCRGPQGDVSFYKAKNRLLLFVSVDTPQTVAGPPPGGKDCASSDSAEPIGFEGIRIWDVSDPVNPRFVKLVQTDCGSHTHTTIPDYDNQRALIYVSSYPLAATGIGPNCGEPSPVNFKPHGKISIVEVPDAAPAAASVLKEQHLHFDTAPSAGEDGSFVGAVGCHDITVIFESNQGPESNSKPKPEAAAAACLSEGQLWDVSDPANPRTIDPAGHTHIHNEAVEIWHSSAFTWDTNVVLFGDEHGGGSAHGCDAPPAQPVGNIWFYRYVEPGTPEAPLLGRYQLPRQQRVAEVCTLHNFNVVPTEEEVDGTSHYIGVSSAYEGGTTVFDFTNAQTQEPFICPQPPVPDPCELLAPVIGTEIAFFDSEGADGHGKDDVWSSYWYNDFIYANGGLARTVPPSPNRGFDVFKLLKEPATQPCTPDETCEGKQFTARKWHHSNPQTQETFQTVKSK